MRAIVFERFGEPAEVLQVRDLPEPVPGRGEVRVRMLAAPINPSDLMTVRGSYGRLPTLPATPGLEGVGIVEAGGGLLGRLLQGKRVAVLNSRTGSWAEKAVLPAKQAIPLSSKLPVEQAAMFFVNPATAYIMTQRVLQVPAGDWLLQTAAGSALGRMIIRLGKRFGFKTINVVRRREQIAELQALGGDVVLAEFDGDIAEQVRRATGDQGVRFAVDPVGGQTGSAVVRSLGNGGRMLVFGTLSGEPLSLSPRALMVANASVEGFWLGHWMEKQRLPAKLKLVRTLTNLILEGVLTSEAGATFGMDAIADAVQTAEKPGRGGKALLKLRGCPKSC